MKLLLYCIPRLIWSAAFLAVLVRIALTDIRQQTISNRHLLIMAGLGVISLVIFREISIPGRFIGAILVSGVLFAAAIFFPGSVGGGDIKLMAVGGFILGWQTLLIVFVLGMLAAGGYCLFQLSVKKVELTSAIALGPFLCGSMALFSVWQMVASILSLGALVSLLRWL